MLRSPRAQTHRFFRLKGDIVVVNPPPASQPVPDPSQPKIVPGLRVGFEMYGTTPGRKLVWLIASNLGQVPVFLNSIPSLQVKMPDGQLLTPTSENWKTDADFPVELRPGPSVNIWRDLRGFATSLKRVGYSGKVNLIVRCRDEASRILESGPILFDIDDYAKA